MTSEINPNQTRLILVPNWPFTEDGGALLCDIDVKGWIHFYGDFPQ
jgi:hypothetical protein